VFDRELLDRPRFECESLIQTWQDQRLFIGLELHERGKAQELYKDVTTHDTDQKRIQEAQKRLAELTSGK
jgi:hypothetical protein